MFTKFVNTPLQLITIRFAAIMCLVLVFAFSAVEAAKKEKAGSSDSTVTVTDYQKGSIVIRLNPDGISKAGTLKLDKTISIEIGEGSLTAYLQEHNLSAVEIGAEMFRFSDGTRLFVFSPSDVYFEQPLELKGLETAEGVIFLDENGKALEYTLSSDSSGSKTVKSKSSPSTYYYDEY
ncbi:hypothetical protein IH992_24845 [Candidatus Poribacteria bacterium]|nr:hypothetical protein [Candidatus Poribacteria bacterium]